MRFTPSRPCWLVTAALVLSVTGRLAAHDFWIEPSTFEAKIDEPVSIHLRVGERFIGEPVARNGAKIERFVLAGPSGERPVRGRDGGDPAGLLRLDAPGIWMVGYRSRPTAVELPAEKFEEYLREEGLERVIADRAHRDERRIPGREIYSRSVKALLRTLPDDARGYDRALGLTLELVPEADPNAAPGGRLPIRLLHEGHPLAEALVVTYRKDSSGRVAEAARTRTDEHGRVTVPAGPGVWLVKSVHMQRAAPGSGAEWESVWTALTYHVR